MILLKHFLILLLKIDYIITFKKETLIFPAMIEVVTSILLPLRYFSSVVCYQDWQGESGGCHTNITHFEGKNKVGSKYASNTQQMSGLYHKVATCYLSA